MSTQGITRPVGRAPSDQRPTSSSAAAEARAWRDNLPRSLRESRTVHGVAIFGIYFTLYWVLFLGAFLLPSPWMRIVVVVLQPIVIGGLFVVGHDAGHHSLVPQGWLNRLLGRLALLPAWHPLTAWA